MNQPHTVIINTPVGPLRLTAHGDHLTEVHLRPAARTLGPGDAGPPAGVLAEAARQLEAYFDGRLRVFDLPLETGGTPFQQHVWQALRRIGYGETCSYAELARRIGRPAAVRAVGAANGQNPIPIVIPCHRVIGSDGKLVGFGGGMAMKRALLALEQGTLF